MTVPQVDYAAVYRHLPVPVLLVTPEFVITDANLAFLKVMGRNRGEVLGWDAFDAFPENLSDPGATGVRDSIAALRRVLATGEPGAVEFQKYDIEIPGSPGEFAPRYWRVVHAPVSAPDGRVALIAVCIQEVTERMRRFMSAPEAEDDRPG